MMYRFKRTRHTDPRREWIRAHLPNGQAGFTFEDLDGIASTFPCRSIQRRRGLLLIEHKWNVAQLDYSQQIVFKEIDLGLRRGLPHYRGFYLVTYPGVEQNGNDEFIIDFASNPKINGLNVSWDDLKRLYLGELSLEGLFG